ncbi:MAG: hypothetical protein MHMPM18_002393 [Marteilia pararefringens]
MILGYGKDHCINTMQGTGLIPHKKDENDESDGDGFFCKCKEGDYMAFFGMCISMADGHKPWATVEIDGVTFGRDPSYARFLPPANEDGLDDYSFFLPRIEIKGARSVLKKHFQCDGRYTEGFDMLYYGGSSYDMVCFCDEKHFMTPKGECVEECDNPQPSNRPGDDSKYCKDY